MNQSPSNSSGKLRVLVLARNYPNSSFPRLGMWAERLVLSCSDACQMKVIAPVPYCPPLPRSLAYSNFRRVPFRESRSGIQVFHPRFLAGPGYSLHRIESVPYYLGLVRLVKKLQAESPFDLIHAHFIYPDGVVAAALGKRLGVPVIITEHAAWRPWLDEYWTVRKQALWAARESESMIAVSNSHREMMVHFTGNSNQVHVIPNVVDGSVFTARPDSEQSSVDRIVFVGVIRKVKGLDVLLRAMSLLAKRKREIKLAIVGESFYGGYQKDYSELVDLVGQLDLEKSVEFLGPKSPEEVAAEIQKSALLVLPSRRESFGAVLVEALACGTPVVATRCGGPEEIVNDEVGVLVPPNDPEALANGIEYALDQRARYDPAKLRAYALENFGTKQVGQAITNLYAHALESFGKKKNIQAGPLGKPENRQVRRISVGDTTRS